MSFSFEFAARDKAAALALVDAYHAPDSVKAFVSTAIANLREDGPVRVKANGHLCDGPGSYEVSTAEIHVAALKFAEPPPAVTAAPLVEETTTTQAAEVGAQDAAGEDSAAGAQA